MDMSQIIAGLMGRLFADLLGNNEPTSQARRSANVGLTLTRDREQENRDLGRQVGEIAGTLASAFTGPLAPFLAPIFAAIGGEIGAWIGGLFGGGSRPFASFDLMVRNGEILVENLKENKRSADQIREFGEQAAQLIEETFAAFGGTITGLANLQFFEQNGKIEIRSQEVVLAVANTIEEAIQALVLQGVQLAEVSGIAPEVLAAIKQAADEAGNDIAAFSAELDIIQQLTGIEYTNAMADAVDATEELVRAAIHYGLEFDDVAEGLSESLRELRDDALAPIAEFLPEATTLADRFEEARANAAQYNAQLQAEIDQRVQQLALMEQQLAAMVALGATSGDVVRLQNEMKALQAIIQQLTGQLIDPALIDQAEQDATKPQGGGGGGRRAARESFEQGLLDTIARGMSDVDAMLDEYQRSVAEIQEETGKLKANSDLAAKAIEALGGELRENLVKTAADIGASFGVSTFAARQAAVQLRRDLDAMAQAMLAAGATMDEVLQALGEANLQIFLGIAEGLAQAIGDEDELRALQMLRHELELHNYRMQIDQLHKLGVISDQQATDLLALVGRWDEKVREMLTNPPTDPPPPPPSEQWQDMGGGMFYNAALDRWEFRGGGPGQSGSPFGGGPPAADDTSAMDRAMQILEAWQELGRSAFGRELEKLAEDFGFLIDTLGRTPEVVDAAELALNDLLERTLAPVRDLQEGMLFSEFSPLSIEQQFAEAQRLFDEMVALGDPSDAGALASLAQRLLGLGEQSLSVGGAGFEDLFFDVNSDLLEFQKNAVDNAASQLDVSGEQLEVLRRTERIQERMADALERLEARGGIYAGVDDL
jgi:hypothetical protein